MSTGGPLSGRARVSKNAERDGVLSDGTSLTSVTAYLTVHRLPDLYRRGGSFIHATARAGDVVGTRWLPSVPIRKTAV